MSCFVVSVLRTCTWTHARGMGQSASKEEGGMEWGLLEPVHGRKGELRRQWQRQRPRRAVRGVDLVRTK